MTDRHVQLARLFFAVLLTVGFVGIAICDFRMARYKTAALGLIYGLANVVLFFF